jgi:exodeoxyribonuclease VIII
MLEELKNREDWSTGVIIEDLSNREYRSQGFLTSSHIKDLMRSENYLKHRKRESTYPMIFGNACHTSIFEQHKLNEMVIELPDGLNRRGAKNKELYDSFYENNVDKYIIKKEDKQVIADMSEAFWSNPIAKKLTDPCYKEVSFFFEHGKFEVKGAARPDGVNPGKGYIIDYKTTENASYGAFQRTLKNYNYHVSLAWYLDALKYGFGEGYAKVDKAIIIAQEKSYPYDIAVYEIDEATIDCGREVYERTLINWAQSKKNNNPGYPLEIQTMGLPAYGFDIEGYF